MSFGPFGRNMCAMLLQCLLELPIETSLAHDNTIASQRGKARTALQCHGNTAVTQEQISHSRCLIQTLKKTWIDYAFTVGTCEDGAPPSPLHDQPRNARA